MHKFLKYVDEYIGRNRCQDWTICDGRCGGEDTIIHESDLDFHHGASYEIHGNGRKPSTIQLDVRVLTGQLLNFSHFLLSGINSEQCHWHPFDLARDRDTPREFGDADTRTCYGVVDYRVD
jgi:hypothetical protein